MNGGTLNLELIPTDDILTFISKEKGNKKIIGFSLETENIIKNSKAKLKNKNLDLIIANNPSEEGAGFAHATNKVSIINSDGKVENLDLMSKKELSDIIVEKLSNMMDGN